MRIRSTILLIIFSYTVGIGQISISEIQGRNDVSPLLGERVTLDSILITAIATGTIFTQSILTKNDLDPSTSEGLWIQYSNTSGLELGDLINCTGIVAEDGSSNTIIIGEEITAIGVNAIPTPVHLDSLISLRNRSILNYENLEGQLVSFSNGIITEPSGRTNQILVNPLGVRSFREPGISYPDIIPGIPQFDENPELVNIVPGRFIDFDLTELPAGSIIVCEGVIIQRPDGYTIWPTVLGVDPQDSFLAPPKDSELTLSVASLNLRQFGTNENNFVVRLEKTAEYISNVAGYPDIIALQEIKDRNALTRLIESIGEIPEGGHYTYYFNPGNSRSSIHSSYLYKNCLSNAEFRRLGVFESLSSGGTLHDRPPVLMIFDHPEDSTRKMRILNLHLRSLNGIEGSNASFVRKKRHEQAVSVARMIEEFPSDDPLIILGDFNAFQFTDGYVDIFSQISGKKSLGAIIPVEPILNDSLSYPLEALPESEQYSYIFNGHSQFLDHILTRGTADFTFEDYFMLRGNADFPEQWEGDPLKEWRVSDHDGILAHYRLSKPLTCKPKELNIDQLGLRFENPGQADPFKIEVEVPDDAKFRVSMYSVDGKSIHHKSYELGNGRHEIQIEATILPGIFFVQIQQGSSILIKKLIVH